MKKSLINIGMAAIVFAVCYMLVWNIGKNFLVHNPNLRLQITLASFGIAAAMTVFVFVKLAGGRRR